MTTSHIKGMTGLPTQTFFNLPEAKRRLIVDLAIAEFAEHGPTAASVSRIVARAGIAKGSLYQYFADKHDLFMYLIDLANAERAAFYAQQTPTDPNIGFYDAVRWVLELGAQFRFSTPAFERLIYFAMFSDHPQRAEVVRRLREHMAQLWRPLVERGIATGEIGSGYDPEFVLFLCANLTVSIGGYAMESAGAPEQTADEFHRRTADLYEQFRTFLEHGLRGPKE
jgi:AcrR family transcriptional regulator